MRYGSLISGYRGAMLVLLACLIGLTVIAHVSPNSLALTHSLLLNVSITTAALIAALAASYFALTEFYSAGGQASLWLGLAFLLLAAANVSAGLVPVLAGWQRQLLAADTAWALQAVVGATLLVIAALSPGRVASQRDRPRWILAGAVCVAVLSAAMGAWIFIAGTSPPPVRVESTLQLIAGDLFLVASALFWRLARKSGRAWFAWLAVNFAVGGFAQFQYTAEPHATNVVHAGDILRLIFFVSILFGLVAEWRRGYRILGRQTRELEVLHALMTVPSVQDTGGVIQHVVRVVGGALGSTAEVVMLDRAELNGNHQTGTEGRGDASATDGGLSAILEARGRRLGTLVVAARKDSPFTQYDVGLLRACAAQACVLLDRSLLYEEVAAGAVVAERSRLAREIHDGLAQHLAFLKMRVAWLKRTATPNDAAQLEDVEGMLGTALAEARQAITTLRSEQANTTAVAAIASYAEEFGRISGLHVHIETDESQRDVGPRARVELLRIVQEALNNVRKHAAANRVDVMIYQWHDGLEIQIHDNGRGLAADSSPEGHFGLDIMRERVESIGGTLDITSVPAQGTQIVVRVPGPVEETRTHQLTS